MDRNMKVVYVYKVDHDLGQNPNPFGHYCTLAYCKGAMRNAIYKYVAKQHKINPDSTIQDMGIWVIGIAGKAHLGDAYYGKLMYAMQVTEILTFNEYWEDSRFIYKTQVWDVETQNIIDSGNDQKNNFEFWRNNNNRLTCGDNAYGKKDFSADYVLISDKFIYYGSKCKKSNELFIERFGFNPNDDVRGHRIFSYDKHIAKKPIPPKIASYIQDEFENMKCLARPTFSAEGFDYLCKVNYTLPVRKGINENNSFAKRVRHC